MEIKVLIYIIGGIVWFVYNARNKFRSEKPVIRTADSQGPLQKVDSASGKIIRPLEAKQAANASNPKIKTDGGSKPAGIREMPESLTQESRIYYKPETVPVAEFPAYSVLENDPEGIYEQISIGNKIGMDIRNGNIDLRQAVVINELLRPVYL